MRRKMCEPDIRKKLRRPARNIFMKSKNIVNPAGRDSLPAKFTILFIEYTPYKTRTFSGHGPFQNTLLCKYQDSFSPIR